MNESTIAEITEKAVTDALMYGVGIICVRNSPTQGLEFIHVHPMDWCELAHNLQMAGQDVKGKMQ